MSFTYSSIEGYYEQWKGKVVVIWLRFSGDLHEMVLLGEANDYRAQGLFRNVGYCGLGRGISNYVLSYSWIVSILWLTKSGKRGHHDR